MTQIATLHQTVNDAVGGLGFDVVEIERLAGGLLRITIDNPWEIGQAEPEPITVENCETVTRHLQYVLEAANVDYKRLEVSSPGIDRLLRHEIDFARFEGEIIDIVLKEPIGEAAQGQVAANRKKFRGKLEKAEQESWQIIWRDEIKAKPGQKISPKRQLPPEQAMSFTLDEISSARLASVVDFKGKDRKAMENN